MAPARSPRRPARRAVAGAVAAVGTVVVLALVAVLTVPALGRAVAAAAVARTLTRGDVGQADLDPVRPGHPVVYLLVGSDRREAGPGPDGAGSGAASRIDGSGDGGAGSRIDGQRADSLALVAVPAGGGPVRLLSVPRDLRVAVPGHGEQKVGGSYRYGARTLLAAVRTVTGVPVQHVVEVDFAGLTEVVDALGGVPMTFPRPLRDTVTGLALPAGVSRVDGRTALALVRSRTYQELRAGRWAYVDPTDLGRIALQQRFLAALLAVAARNRDPGGLRRAVTAAGRHVTVDRAFGAADVRRWRAAPTAGLDAATLPSRPQVDPAEAGSPFPPGHAGSTLFLVRREPDATRAVAAFTAEATHG